MVSTQTLNNVAMSHTADERGGLIAGVAGTISDCNVDISSLISIADLVPGTQIRAKYSMSGAASCWSIFGDTTWASRAAVSRWRRAVK
jgi:hypothetical protein